MRYLQLLITRSEHTAITVRVQPWVLPILEMIHGAEHIAPSGEDIFTDAPLPDAPTEYSRLEAAYKNADPDNGGATHVSIAYGHGTLGVQRLGEELAREKKYLKSLGQQPVVVDEGAVALDAANAKIAELQAMLEAATAPVAPAPVEPKKPSGKKAVEATPID